MPSILERIHTELPAMQIAGQVNDILARENRIVITAPPGAGKSTILPLTILEGLSGKGKILVLEPRRLAARQVAERMAYLLGEDTGATVGYRVRFESKVSGKTRIEVLTEGILTRMLVADPTLDGVDAVIFDEFHERNLNSDTALALVRETQDILRPELRLAIMSATIDAEQICNELKAPLATSEGRMFPVDIHHLDQEPDPRAIPETVSHFIREAHASSEGDILAFLPGEAEIRRCHELLGTALGETHIYPLYGMLSPAEQRSAIAPSPAGSRKVVLATPIAETSITIEGVRVVIDSGYHRKQVFDPQRGLSRLDTVRISLDMADQRAGRAGRVAPGTCYRLWTKATESRMAPCRTPEILEADLAPLVLDVATWGEGDVSALPWLTPPPAYSLGQAVRLLTLMGALDSQGRITRHGRELQKLPCHPRIAQMMIKASTPALKALAADIAAILEEKDPLADKVQDVDINVRIEALRDSGGRQAWARISHISSQYRQLVNVPADTAHPDPFDTGALLASAYPERIAKSRSEGLGRYQLTGSGLAEMDKDDVLATQDWLAVGSMNTRQGGSGRIFLAAPLDPDSIRELQVIQDRIGWDSRKGGVTAQREWRLGTLVVEAKPLQDVSAEQMNAAVAEAAVKEGLSMFDWNDEVANLQRRIAVTAAWRPELELPSTDTESILSRASEWLQVFAPKAGSVAELKKVDLRQVIWSQLSYEQQQAVDRIAPTHIEVPTGSHIKVEYRLGADAPVLRVRLQECFGLADTPRVNEGRTPVLMELLSPGFKPVQLTSDLASFWNSTYFEVRKELRRRYPKHFWPDNPLESPAVRGIRR